MRLRPVGGVQTPGAAGRRAADGCGDLRQVPRRLRDPGTATQPEGHRHGHGPSRRNGLVFGHMGLVSGVFDQVLFSAIGFAVVVTTVVGLLGLQSLWPMIPATADTQEATLGPFSAADALLITDPA